MKFFDRIRAFLSSTFSSSNERERRFSRSAHHSREANVSAYRPIPVYGRTSQSSSRNSSNSGSSRTGDSSMSCNFSQKRHTESSNLNPYQHVGETSVLHSKNKLTTQRPPKETSLGDRKPSTWVASPHKQTDLVPISRYQLNHPVKVYGKEIWEHKPHMLNNSSTPTSKTTNSTNEQHEKYFQPCIPRLPSTSLSGRQTDSFSCGCRLSTDHVLIPFQPCYLPASAKHSFVNNVSSSNLTVTAGTLMQFNISVNDKFGRPVHKSVQYKLTVEQGKKTIFSGSTNKVTLRVTRVRAVYLLFYLNDELIPDSSCHLNVLPSTPHSLKDITLNVESLPKDQSFSPQSNVLYHNQWTTFTAIVVDEFKNQVNTTCLVEVTSYSRTQFRKAKLANGFLKFSMKASDAGTYARISITVNEYSKIANFIIAEDVYVNYNPCSNILSEMTIEGINDQLNKFSFKVIINDVFGNPVPTNTVETCNLEAKVLEPNSEDEKDLDLVIEKSARFGDDHLRFDLNVTGQRPWSKQLAVFLNGKAITSANKLEVQGKERDTLVELRNEALVDDDFDSIPSFVMYDNSRVFIPVSPGLDDGQLIPYDDELCQIQELSGENYALVCKDTKKHLIMGPDFAHVNNIRRVLRLKDRLQIEENPRETKIIFDHCSVSVHQVNTCKEALLHLLRGSYYRSKASEAARVRMDWKKKIDYLHGIFWGQHSSITLKFCKYFKDYYGNLMNKYNRKACDELFSFFNYQREVSEVDLHGLLVADEERLQLLRLDMMRGNLTDENIDYIVQNCGVKGNKRKLKKDLKSGRLPAHDVIQFIEKCESEGSVCQGELETLREDLLRRCDRSTDVDNFIKRCRSESDEAIRKLRQTMEDFDLSKATVNNSPWIEIIVGAGHHSKTKEKQNIRPKVEKFLKERGNSFTPVNKGSLVVTFVQYSGPEPCFGEYYCEKCDRCWKSSKSYTGKYQQCSRCRSKCWPVKQREKEKIVDYRRPGRDKKTRSKPHQSLLCQRCRELGYPCNEDDS